MTRRPANGRHSESIAERRYCPCRPRRERYERTSAFSSVLGPHRTRGAARTALLPSILLPKTLLTFTAHKGTRGAGVARALRSTSRNSKTKRPPLGWPLTCTTIKRSGRARGLGPLRRTKDVLPSSFRVAPNHFSGVLKQLNTAGKRSARNSRDFSLRDRKNGRHTSARIT